MPHLDFATYPGQVFWLAVSFSLLYFIVSKIILPRVDSVVQARESHIGGNLNKAEELNSKAAKSEEKYSELMHSSAEEAREILKKTAEKSAKKLEEKRAKLVLELEVKTKAAERRIAEIERESATVIKAVSAEISLLMAERILQKSKITKAA